MSIATQQAASYYRLVPLTSNEYQTYDEISLSDVPTMPTTAIVGAVTSRTIRYDSDCQSWFVDPKDKSKIRAYRLRRTDAQIEAGAFPTLKLFFDGKGPL